MWAKPTKEIDTTTTDKTPLHTQQRNERRKKSNANCMTLHSHNRVAKLLFTHTKELEMRQRIPHGCNKPDRARPKTLNKNES